MKKANCPRNDQLLPEPKGRNQNKILNYEKGLRNENVTSFANPTLEVTF